jgi:4-hydroxy-4-methyl-2-oxoglutarate aldolase
MMGTRPTEQQLNALKRLGAATVYEGQGQTGAMDSGIKPLSPTFRLAGVALTVDCAPGDNLILHHALTQGRPGDVLVVDAKGFLETGHMGDVMAFAARQAGFAGIVIDGSVRDSAGVTELGYPVFSRGLSIKAPTKNQPGKLNIPIVCGHVLVRPGDVIVGDRDGLVVVDATTLDRVIEAAEIRERHEAELRDAIAQGKTTVELGGLGPKLQQLGIA